MSEKQQGFCVQKGYRGREVNAVLDGAHAMGLEVMWSAVPEPGWVPVGTVEWCAPAFGEHRIDFFPDFLKGWRRRQCIRTQVSWERDFHEDVFVKDATAWKSDWESRVLRKNEELPDGRGWWVSEVVDFLQEWRYYVADGRLVTTGWYAGQDEDEPAPDLGIEWPPNFSGAVDFGRMDDGRLALVECHAPFACGWYGERHRDYAGWMLEAWQHREWWLVKEPSFSHD